MKAKGLYKGLYLAIALAVLFSLALAIVPTQTARADYATFNNPDYYYATIKNAPSGTFYRQAGLSPDGTKIVAQKSWNDGTDRTEIVLMNADGTGEAIISPGDSGVGDSYGYMNPFWGDDGTAIGFAEVHNANPNKIMVYTISTATRSYIYEPVAPLDANNPDFLGNSKTSIVFWDIVGGSADLFTWDGTTLTNITNTANYKEYEPVSNADGTKIVYWSGETTAEPINTTHTLTYSGGIWTKDVGFTPIADSYWAYWTTPAATQIALTVMSTIDIQIYNSAGGFVTDLSGAGYSGGSGAKNFFGSMPQGPHGEYAITSNAGRGATPGRDIVIAAPRTALYVSATGSDSNPGTAAAPFATIQKGINESVAGGTVHVAAGTYSLTASIIVNKSISIIGDINNPANVVIDAVTIPRDSGPKPPGRDRDGFQVAANDVVIKGFKIINALNLMTGAGDGWQNAGITVGGDITLIDWLDPYNKPILIDGGTFSNNIIEGCSVGIYLAMSKNVTVSHNIIRYSTIGSGDSYFANAGEGILNWNTKAWGTGNWQDPINNIIESNVIEYSARQGICLGAWGEIFSVSGTVIRDNIIRYSGNAPGIDLMYVTGALNITGNDIYSNPTGIGVGPEVSDVIAHYNNISGNTAYGINNTSSVIVNATDNWWGSASGPAHSSNTFNVGSQGNAVSNNVDFVPWLNAASPGGASFAPVTTTDPVGSYASIQAGVTASNPGGTVHVAAGTYVVSSQINLNKANLSLSGAGSASTIVQVSGTGERFYITATGVTIDGFGIQKTDKTGVQNIIYIGASNTTITDNEISGQFVIGDGDISRAMVTTGGLSGLNISGNTIHHLRQPAYISGVTTGTISNNYVYLTKGWVVEQGDMTFTNNTWGTGANANVYDIAILSSVGAGYYTDILAMSAANNGAFIEDQRTSPYTLSIVYVDGSVAVSGDGTARSPKKTIAEGITRVVPGGTVYVAAWTYTGAVLAKDVTLIGAPGGGSVIATGVPYKDGGALTTAFRLDATADGAEIRNFTVNCNDSAGYYFGVFARGADNVVVDSLTVNDAVQGITNWGGSNWEIAHNVLTDTIAAGGGGIAIYLGATPPSYLTCSGNYVHDNTISSAATAPDYTCPGVILALDLRNTSGVPNGAEDLSGNRIEDNDYTGTGNENEVGIEIGVIGVEGDAPKIAATLGMIHDNTVSGNTVDGADYGMYFYTVTDLEVLDNDVMNCATAGIYLADGISGGQFSGNSIYGNAYGFMNETGAIVDATNNWWGNASGPAHSSNTFNVGSQGNAVSNNVDFVPWLDAAPPGGVSFAPVTTTDPVGSYASIQAGVTASNPGGTVNVAAGTYNENIVINKQLTVQGAGNATTFINGIGTGANLTTVNITAAGDVTLSGFTITNAPVTNNTDLRFGVLTNSGTAGVTYTISHNKVIGTNNPDAEEDYGIYGRNGGKENLVITNNVVTKTGANNIVVETHQGTTDISYNTLDAGCYGTDAIFVMTHSGVNVAALQKVDNNTIDMGTGVASDRATGITFATAVNSTPGGTFTNVQITHNKVSNLKANRRGIGLANQATTPSAGDINGALITGNTITGAAGDVTASMGINTYGLVTNATITGNTITGVDFSFKERLNGAIIATGTKLNGNSFDNNTNGVYTERTTGTLNATNNWWGDASGPYDPSGTKEVPPCPADPTSAKNADGTGDKVSDNVLYCPWTGINVADCLIPLKAGWNMVSVPVTPADNSVSAVFPGVAVVYTWDPVSKTYIVPTTVEPDTGYWVAVTGNETITVTGVPVTTWTSDIKAGWNMIGSVISNASITNPNDNPDNSVQSFAYWWNPDTKTYVFTTEIQPGKGYWVAATQNCTLTLQGG